MEGTIRQWGEIYDNQLKSDREVSANLKDRMDKMDSRDLLRHVDSKMKAMGEWCNSELRSNLETCADLQNRFDKMESTNRQLSADLRKQQDKSPRNSEGPSQQ